MSGAGSATDLSRRALAIEVSPTVAMSQRAAALAASGERVFDFSVGEPDQTTPASIRAACAAALDAGKTRYTASAGIRELRSAIAFRYEEDFKVGFAEGEVVVTNGGKHALYTACQVLLDRGDEVIVPSPHWPTFTEAVRLAGARPVLVQTREQDGFKVTARMIGKAASPKTRAVIINSPSNPTGAVIDPDELLAIGRMARKRKFSILYDDTYARISFERRENGVLQDMRDSAGDRFVILGTASKSYCMTGWRIGWVLGPKPLVDAVIALNSHSTQCPASFAQAGAVAALMGPQTFVQDLADEYRRRRALVHPVVAAIPGVTCVAPAGGFYLFPNVARYLSAQVPTTLALGQRLLDEKRVAVVPGEGFGAPGHLRISFARPVEELKEGAARLAAFLAELGGD